MRSAGDWAAAAPAPANSPLRVHTTTRRVASITSSGRVYLTAGLAIDRRHRTLRLGCLTVAVLLGGSGLAAQAPARQSDPAAVLTRYCVTCHNERLKTAGFALDPAQLSAASEHADTWEKVVRKLRTSAMPPAGAPRPDETTYDALASAIESTLDRAAAARPQVGKLPLAHRLSRTEYRNAVRDLLALGDLPKELSIDYLLPADNISS